MAMMQLGKFPGEVARVAELLDGRGPRVVSGLAAGGEAVELVPEMGFEFVQYLGVIAERAGGRLPPGSDVLIQIEHD
jgi:hypothetical protein